MDLENHSALLMVNTISSLGSVDYRHEEEKVDIVPNQMILAGISGIRKSRGKFFRIGYLGDLNCLSLVGALAGNEISLEFRDVEHTKGGIQEALAYLAQETK